MASRKYLQYKEKNERSMFSMGMVFKKEENNADNVPPPGQSLLAADSVPEVPPTLPAPSIEAKPSVDTKAPFTVVSATAVAQATSVPVVVVGPRMSAVMEAEGQMAVQDLTFNDDRSGQQKRPLSLSPQKSPMGTQQVSATLSPLLPPAPRGYWVYSAERMLVRSGPWALTSMRPQDEGQAGNWYFLEPMDKVAGVKEY